VIAYLELSEVLAGPGVEKSAAVSALRRDMSVDTAVAE